MTSGSTFPQRLTKIDALTLGDHSYLTGDDTCYFLGEYTARKGYAFSATNNLVLNFKKSLEKRGRPEWQYKDRAIFTAAAAMRGALNAEWLNMATLVPIPPSKAKGDPLHDDRLIRMLRALRSTPALDIRELLVQTQSTEAVHDQAQRPRPEDIEQLYQVPASLRAPAPHVIGLFDDVLTTGAHFKAAQSVLRRTFPNVQIIGVFIARRVPDSANIEEFENLDDR
jgi:hypothetical protein